MALYLIAYDLLKKKDYKTLYDELEAYDAVRVCNSLWCLKEDETSCKELREHFKAFIDSDDRLFVCEVTTWAGRALLASPNDL